MSEIRARFYPAPALSEAQRTEIASLRDSFADLAEVLERVLPRGRNAARALTALEDAATAAIKAVSHD